MTILLILSSLCLLFALARWWYRRRTARTELKLKEFLVEFDRWEVEQELRRLSVYQYCGLHEVEEPKR